MKGIEYGEGKCQTEKGGEVSSVANLLEGVPMRGHCYRDTEKIEKQS